MSEFLCNYLNRLIKNFRSSGSLISSSSCSSVLILLLSFLLAIILTSTFILFLLVRSFKWRCIISCTLSNSCSILLTLLTNIIIWWLLIICLWHCLILFSMEFC